MERKNITHLSYICSQKTYQAVFMFILIKIEYMAVESVVFSLIYNEMGRVTN